jgi:hypothetical protein
MAGAVPMCSGDGYVYFRVCKQNFLLVGQGEHFGTGGGGNWALSGKVSLLSPTVNTIIKTKDTYESEA